MSSKKVIWLKISGICGILIPIVAFTGIFLAVASYPQFSWTGNALSDLGVVEGVTAVLLNFSLVIGGILALIFASGFFIFLRDDVLGRIGVFMFVLAALALIAIGIFPENVKPTHFYASEALFIISHISMFFMGTTFLRAGKMKLGLFTFLLAIVSLVAWIIQFSTRFVLGVAIPETISSISISTWIIVLCYTMLKEISHSRK
jgi:hypothetical membrane protein